MENDRSLLNRLDELNTNPEKEAARAERQARWAAEYEAYRQTVDGQLDWLTADVIVKIERYADRSESTRGEDRKRGRGNLAYLDTMYDSAFDLLSTGDKWQHVNFCIDGQVGERRLRDFELTAHITRVKIVDGGGGGTYAEKKIPSMQGRRVSLNSVNKQIGLEHGRHEGREYDAWYQVALVRAAAMSVWQDDDRSGKLVIFRIAKYAATDRAVREPRWWIAPVKPKSVAERLEQKADDFIIEPRYMVRAYPSEGDGYDEVDAIAKEEINAILQEALEHMETPLGPTRFQHFLGRIGLAANRE